MPSPAGPALPPKPQSSHVELPELFFVRGPRCRDALRPIRLQSRSSSPSRSTRRGFARTLSAVDITDPAREQPVGKTSRVIAAPSRHRVRAQRRGRGLRSPAAGEDVGAARRSDAASRSTARRSAIRGSASSRTGTSARSRASATATACGKRAAARSCRSTRAISRRHAVGRRGSRPAISMPRILALEKKDFRTLPPGPARRGG